jgi:UDP-glucose 4-epimerase
MLKNSKILITGGTGSFGKAFINHLLNENCSEIRILSRDESKQDSLRRSLLRENINYIIGDIRDLAKVKESIRGCDYIFHAAALKQVPSCEFYPEEAIKTNIIGSQNLLKAILSSNVKSAVFLSTDKAVNPINAMGMTKALMEKSVYAFARKYGNNETKVNVTRYGNVMMSRGSVIPLFLDQARSGKKITITHPDMTRFFMSLSESIDLVVHAMLNGDSGDLFVKKSPGARMVDLYESIKMLLEKDELESAQIGIRHGEKMHETLVSIEELMNAQENDDYFRILLDQRDLKYENYFSEGKRINPSVEGFTSQNTSQLSPVELTSILRKNKQLQEALDLNIK